MTRNISRALFGVGIICFCCSLAIFFADWCGANLPEWSDDVRWMLWLSGSVITIIVTIERQLISNKEAFRIGVKVGQSPTSWDGEENPNASAGPPSLRGSK